MQSKPKCVALILVIILISGIFHAGLTEAAEVRLAKKSQLENDGGHDTSVATNTETGETFVVWWTRPNGVKGRIFNAQGKPVTKTIRLGTKGGQPSVAYNPVTHEYLLAWSEQKGKFTGDVYVQRLNLKGRKVGQVIRVSSDPAFAAHWSFEPTVLFHPKTNGYAIFWLVHLNGVPGFTGRGGGMLLTDRGEVAGSFLKITDFLMAPDGSAGIIETVQDWIYLPSADKFVGISGRFDRSQPQNGSDYYLYLVDPLLKSVSSSKINKSPIPPGLPGSLDLALISDDSAVAFYTDADGTVKGRRIDSRGKLRGKAFRAFEDPLTTTGLSAVHAAFTQTSLGRSGILLGNRSDSTGVTLWAQLLNNKGKPNGAPVEVFAVSDDSQYIFGHVLALPSSIRDTVIRFTAFETTLYLAPVYTSDNRQKLYQLLLDVEL